MAVSIQDGRAVFYNNSECVVKRAPIVASALGNTAVVAAVAGKKIVVLGMVLTASAAVNIKFQSATNDKTGLMYANAAGWSVAIECTEFGLFETNVGEALNINLSGAFAVGGFLSYIEAA